MEGRLSLKQKQAVNAWYSRIMDTIAQERESFAKEHPELDVECRFSIDVCNAKECMHVEKEA